MAKAYSTDLRERAVKAVMREGCSCHEAARRFGVGVSSVIRWVQRLRDHGSVAPDKMGGRKPKKLTGHWRDWLLDRCRERAFTLRGLVGELGERGLKVDYRSVWAFVHAEQLTFKKRP
jgi:transposase